MEDQKTYKIVRFARSVRYDMMTGLRYKDALEICDGYDWVVCPDGDGGFEWDLEIEEED